MKNCINNLSRALFLLTLTCVPALSNALTCPPINSLYLDNNIFYTRNGTNPNGWQSHGHNGDIDNDYNKNDITFDRAIWVDDHDQLQCDYIQTFISDGTEYKNLFSFTSASIKNPTSTDNPSRSNWTPEMHSAICRAESEDPRVSTCGFSIDYIPPLK